MSIYQIEETEQGEFEGRYTIDGWPNVAVLVKGWEVEPDEDTEWSGCYNKTGAWWSLWLGMMRST